LIATHCNISFLDTLVLNVYPTDHAFELEERRIDPLLREELTLLKGQAQEIEEDFPTRFAFNGVPLVMRAGSGKLWADLGKVQPSRKGAYRGHIAWAHLTISKILSV
jgi:hypothetical protein